MRAIVIGAGISGLACAFRLAKRGADVLVLERADRVGGAIETVSRDGFLFELGPQNFLPAPALAELIRAVGLEQDLLSAPAHAPRYVFAGGRLHQVPMGPGILVAGSLLGFGTRFRILRDLVGRSRPPGDDETVAQFIRRKFGPELLDRLAGPLVSGMYAGDPERLGLRDVFPDLYLWEAEQGSVLRGAMHAMRSRAKDSGPRPSLVSLRRGNASLTQALAAALGERVRLRACVEAVSVAPPAVASREAGLPAVAVHLSAPGGVEKLYADAVFIATPADAAASILAGAFPQLAEALRSIDYAPVAVVDAGYRRQQVRHSLHGFGMLVAQSDRGRLLGTVWSSSLFPGRAPAGAVNVASFAGGATDASIAGLPHQAIAECVEKELAPILGITGPPVECVVTLHRRALPQYNVGHRRLVDRIRSEVGRVPGLSLLGNHLDGVSVGSCVDLAFRAADAACAAEPALPSSGS